jgi:hypothetical protein
VVHLNEIFTEEWFIKEDILKKNDKKVGERGTIVKNPK